MTSRRFILILPILFLLLSTSAQVKSPGEFLPHQLGEHFTPHHLLIDYYQHVEENSPLVKLHQYGTTNQDRPLITAIVTSPENHEMLDDIRLNNLRMTGLEEGTVDTSISKTICWLSFSVHGNEAAGTESSYQVLFDLVDPTNEKTKKWLENTVVILDPCINPDGYSRYTHWVRNVTMDENNDNIIDIEHQEPWPGGRVNHYLFDLNRDWAWQTQVESRQRLVWYHQWMPHIHADLHEMGHESPYYFAPAARPYHDYITKWQRDFQVTIGKNHAKYFDEEGWLYFTKEVYDLYYPSYGDTYPTFNGAIGMTYEQGGSGRAGRGIKLRNGEQLTLMDRISHHKTSALSTIEVTSHHSDQILENFHKFFNESQQKPPGEYRTYIIKRDHTGNRLMALAELLDNQKIQYGTVNATTSIEGFDYKTRKTTSVKVEPGDMVVSATQPKAVLTQVLLNPENPLEDSLTYDITAWSLPYAYGLHAVASTTKMEPDAVLECNSNESLVDDAYAYLIRVQDLDATKLVANLVKHGLSIRVAPKAMTVEGNEYAAGTVVITKADNRSKKDKIIHIINKALKGSRAQISQVSTGFVDTGHDFGSRRLRLTEKPKVLTLSGRGIGNNAYGQLKWYFDRVIDYPLTTIDIQRLGTVDLDDFNTIILPDGFYSMNSSTKNKLSSWIRDGGKLISIGRANRNLRDAEGFALKTHATDDEKSSEEKETLAAELAARYDHYNDRERKSISGRVPGAIFRLKVDESHPLGFGIGSSYYSLRTNNLAYPLIVNEANVITHPKMGGEVVGFAGSRIREKLNDTVAFAVETQGRGQVIYMVDNPLYRGFWYNGLFLFGNALFLVN